MTEPVLIAVMPLKINKEYAVSIDHSFVES